MLFSAAQLFPGFLAYFFEEKDLVKAFITTGFITFSIGFLLFFLASKKKWRPENKRWFHNNNFFLDSTRFFWLNSILFSEFRRS